MSSLNAVFSLLLIISANVAHSQSACIDKVAPNLGYSTIEAAKLCKGGVTIECIDKVAPSVGYSTIEAARLCADH